MRLLSPGTSLILLLLRVIAIASPINCFIGRRRKYNIRAVQAGIMKPLVELMADFGSNMVDKSTFVMSILVSTSKARAALVEEGGIPVLVEIIEVGSQRQKEITMVILLQICDVPPVSIGLTTVVIPDDWPGFFLWAGVVVISVFVIEDCSPPLWLGHTPT
ncbi:hypothetical protein L1887_19568 [Cichorium endivia]|nr:hypothetical protein L1887_19568 [Cichorium endivia]